MKSMTASKKSYFAFAYSFLLVMGIVLLYPLFYAIFGSITTQSALDGATSAVFPPLRQVWSNLYNYIAIFAIEGLGTSILLTLVRFAWHLVISVAIAVLLGFIFARMRFPMKNVLFLILLSSMMIPSVAMTVPNYIFMSKLGGSGDGLIDNPAILFVSGLVNVYNIFLVRQSVSALGGEMEEAAEIDGAGLFRTVFLIYMPLLKPVLAVMFVNLFAGHWSDYTTSLVYLRNAPEWHTIGYKVTEIMEYYAGAAVRDFPKMYATAIVSTIPPIIAFLSVQSSFVEGLALGGVKG